MVIQKYLPIISYDYGKIYQGLKDYTNAIKYYEETLELSEFLSEERSKGVCITKYDRGVHRT